MLMRSDLYETCACFIHTNLHTLSAACALVLSSHINVCTCSHVLHEALVIFGILSVISQSISLPCRQIHRQCHFQLDFQCISGYN